MTFSRSELPNKMTENSSLNFTRLRNHWTKLHAHTPQAIVFTHEIGSIIKYRIIFAPVVSSSRISSSIAPFWALIFLRVQSSLFRSWWTFEWEESRVTDRRSAALSWYYSSQRPPPPPRCSTLETHTMCGVVERSLKAPASVLYYVLFYCTAAVICWCCEAGFHWLVSFFQLDCAEFICHSVK